MTLPAQWRIFSNLCTFVGPVTVADYDGDAVTDFKLNLRPDVVASPSDPDAAPGEWHTPDVQDGDQGLFVGQGGTVDPGPGTYRLAPAYQVGGTGKWFGGPDIGLIYIS